MIRTTLLSTKLMPDGSKIYIEKKTQQVYNLQRERTVHIYTHITYAHANTMSWK